MRAVIVVIGLSLGISEVINASRTEQAEWDQRIQQSNKAGQEWEESQNTSEVSLDNTEKINQM